MFSKALLSIALLLTTIVFNAPIAEARHGNHCDNGFRSRNYQASLSPQAIMMAQSNVPFKRARRMSNESFNRYDRQMYRVYKNDDNCGGWRSNRSRAYDIFCGTGRHDNGRRVAGRFSRRWF